MATRPGYIWSGTEWVSIGQEAVVAPVSYQATAPTSPATGDIWIESDVDVPGIDTSQFLRWRKTMAGGETSVSGADDNNLTLSYTPSYEQVYLNGVLLVRGQDYTATTGTSITGLTALVVNDVVEVFGVVARTVGDVYTQSQIDTKLGASGWTSYTPTWTNLTVGNGTTVARYTQIGKTVHVYLNFTFGSTTTVAGIFYPSLPITSSQVASAGAGWGFDTSATLWNNFTFSHNNYFVSASGARYNATHPWTWATGDVIVLNLTYEAA